MKLLRVSLFILIAVVGLLIVGVGVAFNSGFQTWAARRAVASQPGLEADIGRVSIGLDIVELTAIRLVQPGIILTLPSVVIEVPLTRAARKKVDVKRIKAHGWTLDLTAPEIVTGAARERRRAVAGFASVLAAAEAAPAEKSSAFTGIFGQLKLPVEISLEEADLSGEIIFPVAEGQPPGKAKVTLTGGQLGSGREGKFSIVADAALAGGAVNSLSARSQILIRMDTPSSIDRISFAADAKAAGVQFPAGAEMRIDLQAERVAQGAETYRLIVESAGKPLVSLQAQLPAGADRLDGTVALSIRTADLAPFALGHPVPAFEAKADSKFGANTTFSEFSADGSFDLAASQLEIIQPELKALGQIKVNSTFAVQQSGSSVRVKTLQVKVHGAQPFATVDARQAFEFNLGTSELSVADPARDLLAVSIEGVPLAWAQAFLKDISLTGGEVRGVLVARAANGGFTVRAQSPLVVSPFSVGSAGKPVLRNVNISMNASAEMSRQGWQAEMPELAVREGGRTLIAMSLKAGQVTSGAADAQPVKATGKFSADIPAMLAQPAAADFAVLTKGAASGEFTISSGSRHEIGAKLVITDLVATTNEAFPKVTIDVRADLESDGKFEANLPILVEQSGRKSDLALAASGRATEAGTQIEARVTSKRVHVNDVKILLAPLAGPPTNVPPKTTPPGAPDKTPPWAGVSGKVSIDFDEVVYSPELVIKDVTGSVAIGDAALTLEGLKAALSTGGQVNLTGGVTFTPASPKPYSLKADVAVSELDTGPIMKALSPGSSAPPIVEGKFDLVSQVMGTGATLGALTEQARGDARISSKGGVFRPVQSRYIDLFSNARSQLVKRTEQAGAIGAIAGVLGAKLPGSLGSATAKAQVLAERMGEIESILKLIAELRFDQLTLDIGGDTSLNTILRDLTITTPELRFVGSGGLKYAPDVPLWKQALSLSLNGGARGKTADVMKKANLLGTTADKLGYIPLSVKLDIDGTVEKPDTSKLLVTLLERVVAVKLQPGDMEKLKNGDVGVLLNLISQLR